MFYLVYVTSQNAWIKFEAHMVSAIHSFNHFQLFCKRIYITILTAYKNDEDA
jgi:hypothetical protein